jgi:hypothetical protein
VLYWIPQGLLKLKAQCRINGLLCVTMGHAVAQLVEALRYKLEGCGFDSRWYH